MAGPWFTVQESGSQWQKLGQVWISNGDKDCKGQIEIKLEMTTGSDLFSDEPLVQTEEVEL